MGRYHFGSVASCAPQNWGDAWLIPHEFSSDSVPDKLRSLPVIKLKTPLSLTRRTFYELYLRGDESMISSIIFRLSLLGAGCVSYLISKLEEDKS